ncbi:hypothetical protein A2276_01155 [candidate division WOR-1 bacterium RIFOXYA12_FULL_43_27]|uniref:Ribonuclease VapC n=1 Tax=candidate division WOR-1 bacterium RIFOXYC2_FULL_46_14 TaxID=1802587 RepID=A0A1F4U4S8_UNCSA|nr:MAG: hypothetical protein A2276_01155 [candidate division WOR-1 bacterium RIFOXYA12_FULL_43_27]OGC20706.1 MAG: hypothetical protein A2292_06720 [candidate division WOR-1 bacterium RIFOXYB2_FULL_46_45]OGC31557.1 MAG: hypothetical protein A2232_04730 [candidate division WOR-1 bacterium RIFOXYA2_FULL_46_56]OGC39964.1 MAG: hypothetical protein A2438_05570 [candidate division WOR-1 bacterium RIFOXYC2_FULL_46_14]
MANKKPYVLDTSAIFCLKDNAPGAEKVEKILEGQNKIYASFMSYMEYLYIVLMRMGEEQARADYLKLTMLPIEVVESNEELRFAAAELKANHQVSLADAWIAATAQQLNAVLVHRDPEFEALNKQIECLVLPYKI